MSKIRERLVSEDVPFMICALCVHAKKRASMFPCRECMRGQGEREMFDPNVSEDIAAETARCIAICKSAELPPHLEPFEVVEILVRKMRGEG